MPAFSHIFQLNHQVFSAKFKSLFIAKVFHAIGVQLTLFFLPLFLYQVGSETRLFANLPLSAFQAGVLMMGGYFLIQRITVFFVSIPASRLISAIGSREGMIIGQIINVFVLSIFVIAKQNPEILFFVAILEGVKIAIFWNSYFTLLSDSAVFSKMGESVGTIEFFTKLIQVVIPAAIGIMVVRWGFGAVFGLGIIFHLISIVALFFIATHARHESGSFKELRSWFSEPSFQRFSISILGKYFVDSLQFMWPFFVFLIIGKIERVGYLYSFVFFLSLLFVYFAGWYVDHEKGKKPFTFSGIFIGITWLLRTGVTGVWSIVAVDTLDKLASSIFVPFYDSLMMRRGKGKKALAYFAYRETIFSFSAIIFWSFFLIYFLFVSNWRGFLLLGSVGMLLALQLTDKKSAPTTQV